MEKDKLMNEYMKAYYKNEYDANKQMSYALLFSGCLLFLIMIGYIAKLFNVTREVRIIVSIVFPIMIVFLVIPMFLLKTKYIEKPRYKYFLLYNFVLVIAILNIIIPKHAIIAWGICIVIANHYYNPKIGLFVFVISAISMLICIYTAMFLGEFDPNLLTGEVEESTATISNTHLLNSYADTPLGRYNYLHDLKAIGRNRYVAVLKYYYLARLICLAILFFVSNSLNIRTYKLLLDEIKVNSEHEKMNTELEVARSIQLHTLPKEFITSKEINIQAELIPVKTVGGDFYDYINLDDDNIALVIGDVSGKGIGAAMFMMKTITCFNDFASIDNSPSQTLKLVNKQICQGNENDMFVTCIYAIFNKKTGLLRYANAGHTYPIIGKKRSYHYLKGESGFILGAFEECNFVDEEVVLEADETFTFYTDGITEAQDIDGNLYGEDRLIKLFNNQEYPTLVDLHLALKKAIFDFEGENEQSDDITYITLKYFGTDCDYDEVTLLGSEENVSKLLDFISSFAKKNSLSRKVISDLLVIGDELLSNIVKYGYKDKKGDIYLSVIANHKNHQLSMVIMDSAEKFDPFSVENDKIGGDANEIKEGGLGILIVKNLVDSYAYDYINDKNVITLMKKW